MKTIDPPADWDVPITAKGFSRNMQGLRYDVRLTVHGKQTHIAACYTQADAARAYDLALWLLGPKLGRRIKPNDPEGFELIGMDDIERECPRLLKLYAVTPFRNIADESIDESVLRSHCLAGSSNPVPTHGLTDFNRYVEQLKRFRLSIESEAVKLAKRRSLLVHLKELAQAPNMADQLVLDMGALVNLIQKLEQSMELQRSYYQKFYYHPENSL